MINQTRTLLVVALLFVVYLLWQAWQHDYPAVPPPPPPASSAVVPSAEPQVAAVPTAPASTPQASAPPPPPPVTTRATPKQALVTASNDVLKLTIDPRGGTIVGAALLDYPQKVKRGSPPVQLLNEKPDDYYVAQNGLIGADGSAAPSHLAEFTPQTRQYSLAPGQDKVTVTLDWHDPATGVAVVKRYTLTRGSYVVGLSQQIDNRGDKPWHGNAYEQLDRVEPPPPPKHLLEFYNPDSFAFTGGAWYSPEAKFNKLKFDDFGKDPLRQSVTGGWIAMTERFFVSAWIPNDKRVQEFTSVELPAPAGGTPRYVIRSIGPGLTVAPGASATSDARLYVGPNLQNRLGSIAPGLNLTIAYGWSTLIAQPMFKLLSFLDGLVHNWGLAIIVLVLLIQAATWKLTEAQYKSGARVRKLQPRLKALKERFGDDKQKYQQAMMELYKKEKVNPVAGCLPVLITLPIFFALYYVLIYSVELRHAAFLWIPDLSSNDPYFILPVLYGLAMLGTTFLTPMQAGMDGTQAKLMKLMPVLSVVIFIFFPAGLTLYYTVRSICNLGQQWYITRKIERAEARARA